MGDKVFRKSLGRFFFYKGRGGESVCWPEIQRMKTETLNGIGQNGSLWQLQESAKEQRRDENRREEKRGALATWKKWLEGEWCTAKEREKGCVCVCTHVKEGSWAGRVEGQVRLGGGCLNSEQFSSRSFSVGSATVPSV